MTGRLSLALPFAALIAYAPSLPAPFLSDDYIHLTNASVEPWAALIHRVLLTHPAGGDRFFRPVGSFYYWLLFKLAAFNPVPWHAGSAAIHAANTMLVFLLALRLCRSSLPSLMAAALFAWHGAHVEDVCWLAAVFDLLAAFFVLLVLVLVTQSRPRQAIVVASSALACLSKEAAYCLPFLVLCVALFLGDPERRQIIKRAVPVAVACAVVFLYRLWFLQGFGGYRTASGSSIALTLRPLSVLQALALRIWAVLFIPLNWSQKSGAWLGIAAIAMLFSLAVTAVNRRWLSRPNLFPPILFVLLASLPALPLLLIGSDLAGARVLYLPSVGFSLLWMRIVESVKLKNAALALGASTLLFQLAALSHNQQIWVKVAQTAKQACLDTASIQKQNPSAAISVNNLPATLHGVYFFQNGFPQCVAIAEGVTALPHGAANPNPQFLMWNNTTERVELKK